jgi:hypothetical protein
MREKYISLLISAKEIVVHILTAWFKGLAAFAVHYFEV